MTCTGLSVASRLRRFHIKKTGWECSVKESDRDCPGLIGDSLVDKARSEGRAALDEIGDLVLH